MTQGRGCQITSLAIITLLVAHQFLFGDRIPNLVRVQQSHEKNTTSSLAEITLGDSSSTSAIASNNLILTNIMVDDTVPSSAKAAPNEAILKTIWADDAERSGFWSKHSFRPPLATFLNTETSMPTEDAKFLLDFAIIGFAKAGTTALGTLLSGVAGIIGTYSENVLLHKNIPIVVKTLYGRLPKQMNNATIRTNDLTTFFKIGNRCPGDIRRFSTINNLKQSFPTTKLIISVRSPVLWFQSFYNYRISEGYAYRMKDGPNGLIRKIEGNFYDVSTSHGEFHKYMAYLQKTPLQNPDELSLILPFIDSRVKRDQRFLEKLSNQTHRPKVNMTNPVFFLEISQLSDKNESRAKLFRKDLATFLGLPNELPPVPRVRPNDKTNSSSLQDVNRKNRMIDICDPEFKPVREELMNISRNASLWFRNYFMKSQDVFVSSRERLEFIFQTEWMKDPCSGPNG